MQNSNVYTINNTVPPSSAEATGASETQDVQFDQRYPHMVANPTPSTPPIGSVQKEYVLDKSQLVDIITDVIEKAERARESKLRRLQLAFLIPFVCMSLIVFIITMLAYIYKIYSNSM